jgi:acylpyruvate hydrolase
MRFVSAWCEGQPIAALAEGDLLRPLRGITELGPDTPSSILADPPLADVDPIPRSAVRLRPTVPHPAKIICVGLNYRTHITETGRGDSDYPVLFTKFAASLIGPYEAIMIPPESQKVDWEGEIAAVIGTRARRVAEADALSYVAGYTIANDVSMRDFQRRTHQWLQGKAWDASTPLGPELVTPDEVPPWAQMRLTVTYDGDLVQDSTADLMIFPVATLISTISTFTTLEPGDVIVTGTPGGVGDRRVPPVYMRPGKKVAVEVTGLGRIENELEADHQRG